MKKAIPQKAKNSESKRGGQRPGAGRPATGKDPVRTMRLSDEFIASVDEWAAANFKGEFISRTEAIRQLVKIGLKAKNRKP
jgi:hypothetical protein